MPFSDSIKQAVVQYVESHLPDDKFYQDYFWFISDLELRNRLEEEFRSARYIYKILEGIQAKDWLLNTQVRLQILLYASIYEAVLHHILLQDYKETAEVANLMSYDHKKPINISGDIEKKIIDRYNPIGPISIYQTERRPIDERKVVFEEKAKCAKLLGLIDGAIFDVVCEVYSLRNAIHLHAELRRGVEYEIEIAKKAYWKLQGFCGQIAGKMLADGKVVK